LIICNHQSHLDLPVLMSISPKMIFLTNDWVWNNPFYGRIIHQAEFLPVSAGMDVILPRLRDLRDRGYSIVVFPEGTRSADCSILRFRQGAFMLARELELDIVPMVLHGAGHYLPKKDFMFRKGRITLKILPRISTATMDDLPTRKWASVFRRMISDEYTAIATRRENVEYFRSLVLYKYAWRGWRTVARCKSTLKQAMAHPGAFAAPKESAKIRIVNSGIGTFALLYALVNPRCEVFAFESCRADHLTASGTPALPPNLHFKNAIWESDYGDDADFDLTIALDSDNRRGRDSESLKLNIKS
ncbi:MAG: 1-acyl-sn-glycerol-3-phosphate acyltransferase, partial [Muribaculaceae bacterium]|nr:1-acyl-sn-glycerol-3-phosphate acyltransferase [Muribaculaceae bacterium]